MLKKAWDNLCATFEKSRVDNTLQLCQEFYNLKNGGKHFCVSSHWQTLHDICNFRWKFGIYISRKFTTLFRYLVISFRTHTNEMPVPCKHFTFWDSQLLFLPLYIRFLVGSWVMGKKEEKRQDQVCIKWTNHLQECNLQEWNKFSTSSLHGATLFNKGITGIGATLDYNFIWALVILPYT